MVMFLGYLIPFIVWVLYALFSDDSNMNAEDRMSNSLLPIIIIVFWIVVWTVGYTIWAFATDRWHL